MSELIAFPIETLYQIFSDLEIDQLINLSELELYSFLNDKDFIRLYALKQGLPFENSLIEYKQYFGQRLDMRLLRTAEQGDLHSAERIIELYTYTASTYGEAMVEAAYNGHSDIIELMILHGGDYYGHTMIAAAESGYIDIVLWMLEKVLVNSRRQVISVMRDVAIAAAKAGHLDIVKLMIEKGNIYINATIIEAAKAGHIDIVEYILERHPDTDLVPVLYWAAERSHADIVKLVLDLGAKNDWALINAATRGYVNIVKLILESGNFDEDSIELAERVATEEAIELIREYKDNM